METKSMSGWQTHQERDSQPSLPLEKQTPHVASSPDVIELTDAELAAIYGAQGKHVEDLLALFMGKKMGGKKMCDD